jgi:hypothetical protein
LQSQLSCFWKEPAIVREYRSAVSMHGHTNHSKECLYFIGEYVSKKPLLKAALETQTRQAQTKSSITVDFWNAHWTPPLTPIAAYELERDQIERVLGLVPMISLTDHDTIEAPQHLRLLPASREIPISVEWSVPYKETVLHVGVHNLPPSRAESIMGQFADFTKKPEKDALRDILKMLHEMRDVLVVLNHPMWDLAKIGKQRHVHIVHRFVARFGMYMHALELGGLRTWEENQEVLDFAGAWNQLVVGGGDRHGAEASAVLNLTNAETFPEFIHEVREKRRCHVLFMPQYSEPFVLRIFQSLIDVIREYPEYPRGARRWDERVFHPDRYGVVRPLSQLWTKPPGFIEAFFSAVRLLESAPIRMAICKAFARPEHQMRFVPNRGREVGSQWTSAYESRSSRTRMTKSTA